MKCRRYIVGISDTGLNGGIMGLVIKQEIMADGKYRLVEPFTYYSKRYRKFITVDPGRYDGATGACDINSAAWWVHDQLCNTGVFDDGTRCTNRQASQILQDILADEGRWVRKHTWFWATLAFGGGEARKNGMFKLRPVPA